MTEQERTEVLTGTAARGPWAEGRHPVDVGQLVMGVAFLGLVGLWALIASDRVGGDDVRWLLPLPWLLAGGAGLAAVALAGRRRGRDGPA
ncbi:hypothetical protein [Nocardioides perillae]|uniref:Uncharacterized protein n=1 Tax=Nocardioides perillae TaxID=1119534 RepID=A0A7Y9RR68_9ACTN|nr:hypothetical protein [Nocardioides perillae]NYG55071.1 hypothetical protein [Nocardioides perillae]